MTPEFIEQIKRTFMSFDAESIESMVNLYSSDVEFIDPVGEILGIEAVMKYFRSTLNGLIYCNFEYGEELLADKEAWLTWKMHFTHKKLNKGQEIVVSGCTHFKTLHQIGGSRVSYHRDYYDMSEMLFDYVPIVGWGTKKIKRHMALSHS